MNGLRESVTAFGEDVKDVSSRDVLELMLLTQYWCVYRTAHMLFFSVQQPQAALPCCVLSDIGQ